MAGAPHRHVQPAEPSSVVPKARACRSPPPEAHSEPQIALPHPSHSRYRASPNRMGDRADSADPRSPGRNVPSWTNARCDRSSRLLPCAANRYGPRHLEVRLIIAFYKTDNIECQKADVPIALTDVLESHYSLVGYRSWPPLAGKWLRRGLRSSRFVL